MSESFNWNHPSLNKSHFHSLANLLSLRNGGQAEPSSLPDTLLEEEWDPDDAEDGYAPSVDTNFAHRLSESGHARLKRRFLDCLAEFAANRKGGLAVACSAMDEAEDNVVVWIARNAGFADEDSSVFSRLGELLGSLSNNSVHRAETLLWEEMVSYQRNRIENDSIPGLRASFKAYDASRARNNIETPSHGSVSDGILSVLRNLLFDPHLNNTGTLEKHTRLVVAAYNLRRTKDVEEELFRSPSATSKSKTLWVHICLLARLRVAFERFKDISLLLPSFAQVSITLVHHPLAPTNPPQCPLNLNQTFALLGLDPSPATTKAVLGQNWTVGKAKLEFAKRQKQKLNIHAEVQMLLFLNTSGSSPSLVRFPYFGCSKLSCFKCNRFLQSYGRFTTRGCHGRLFKPWTVPSVDRLLPGHSYRIARALLSLQHEVHKMLKASVEAHIPHERTSAVGGSSIFSGGQREQHSQRQLQVDRLRMKAERDRVAEIFRR
ncbi:hypothetical protein CC80DRAFT_589306 [Byssothecium circinans]|uniref:Uncharacterized protein n=1 Tax=Byssothecium circinans TaxID=147558 RepID=A0A6A5UDL0_9PLEO|nr:hypothetical protein CC80DRAFT_589306 [Byssothecium circinans]